MFRNILVTLDGSQYSEVILPAVTELAAGSGASVTLFMAGELPAATPEAPLEVQPPVVSRGVGALYTPVITAPRYVETKAQAIERREREMTEYLEEKAQPLRERGIQVQVAVDVGDGAGDRIIEYARSHPVDLIAMATHGHTGLRTLIFGSVTGKVLADGVRPLLLVRPQDLGQHAA
ncbi:MAG: universal stress protein [Chloroflexi bacterium]|nr:universal stress protein [Chloroflexota bacterium]